MSLLSLSHSLFHSFFSRYIYNVHYTIVTKKQYVFLLFRFSFFLSFNTFVFDLASFYRHCFTRFLHVFIIFFFLFYTLSTQFIFFLSKFYIKSNIYIALSYQCALSFQRNIKEAILYHASKNRISFQ